MTSSGVKATSPSPAVILSPVSPVTVSEKTIDAWQTHVATRMPRLYEQRLD